MNTKRATYEWFKTMYNTVAGPKTASSFQTTGQLTVQEFVEAGDHLVMKTSWKWAEGDANTLPFLPANKKYLILKDIVCKERATMLMEDAPEGDGGDDWVTTHTNHVPKSQTQKVEVAEDTEKADEDFNWSDDEEDGAAAAAAKDVQKANEEPEEKYRLYDVTLVYDQYYASPRVYLFGYSENNHNQPLTKNEMMEDVYAENREKTVTVDPHPFLHAPCISIHPCRHAETMKRILTRIGDRFAYEQEEEGVPEAERIPFIFPTDQALFVFLKFISSVVPTIKYDLGGIEVDM